MKRRTLKDLYNLMGLEETAKAKTLADQKIQRLLLSQMRKQLGFTQAALAKKMRITQSALSQMESQEDMQLTTLRRLAKTLGAELDVVLRFPDRAIVLTSPKSL